MVGCFKQINSFTHSSNCNSYCIDYNNNNNIEDSNIFNNNNIYNNCYKLTICGRMDEGTKGLCFKKSPCGCSFECKTS